MDTVLRMIGRVDLTRKMRQPISRDSDVGNGPKPDNTGFLSSKVSQFILSSKSGHSERPLALISGSEGGAVGLSRAGIFGPAVADP